MTKRNSSSGSGLGRGLGLGLDLQLYCTVRTDAVGGRYRTNTGTRTSRLHRAREEVTRYGRALTKGISQLVRRGLGAGHGEGCVCPFVQHHTGRPRTSRRTAVVVDTVTVTVQYCTVLNTMGTLDTHKRESLDMSSDIPILPLHLPPLSPPRVDPPPNGPEHALSLTTPTCEEKGQPAHKQAYLTHTLTLTIQYSTVENTQSRWALHWQPDPLNHVHRVYCLYSIGIRTYEEVTTTGRNFPVCVQLID